MVGDNSRLTGLCRWLDGGVGNCTLVYMIISLRIARMSKGRPFFVLTPITGASSSSDSLPSRNSSRFRLGRCLTVWLTDFLTSTTGWSAIASDFDFTVGGSLLAFEV